VIAHSSLKLSIPANRYNYEGRSHSLWFCNAQQADQYALFEIAFMDLPMGPQRRVQYPFALDPGLLAAKALWRGIADVQVAWSFTRLTVGALDEFLEQWVGRFADAATGRLTFPHQMPER
jgi:serine/threonine-protein kinase